MQRWSLALLMVAGCGRFGFGHANDAAPVDDGSRDTGPTPGAIACADLQLGSALGSAVASGTTVGKGNRYGICDGDGPDVTFGWSAPATATYRIDLCSSPNPFDSTLSVRNGSCAGEVLACNDDDDDCGDSGASGVTVSLTVGQSVVITVDGFFDDDEGDYQLAITQR
jgi:hypothetical protein